MLEINPVEQEAINEDVPVIIEPKTLELEQKFIWNFEDVKANLSDHIERYAGLVVTEENLKSMEKTQKEIAGLRTKIGKFRLAVKYDMEKPFKIFEQQINELAGLIESVEKPIKDQLEKYENQRRADKEASIKNYIAMKAQELSLEEKYTNQIVVDNKWLNRTQKWADTENDILQRLAWNLDIQSQERQAALFREQKAEMAKILCQSLSAGLGTPLTYEEIESRIDSMQDILQVKAFIEEEVTKRKDREERAAQLAIERKSQERVMPPIHPPAPRPYIAVPPPVSQGIERWDCDMHIVGVTVAQMEELKAFMHTKGFLYSLSNYRRK